MVSATKALETQIILGKILNSDWNSMGTQVYRYVLGGRKWFRTCCNTRMFNVSKQWMSEEGLNAPEGSRKKDTFYFYVGDICAICGYKSFEMA